MSLPPLASPSCMARGGELTHPASVVDLITWLAPRRPPRPRTSVPRPDWGPRAAGSAFGPDPGVEAALGAHGIAGLSRFSAPELAQACGLTSGHAQRVAVAFALGREVERARMGERPSLKHPSAVARLMAPLFRGLNIEAFYAILLDARHRLKERVLVGQGTLISAPVHPREVFGPAIRMAAAAVIVVHNHPSGDPEPSGADREVTRRLVRAGEILGVPLLDHLIWADGSWTSLREIGDWPR